MVSVEAFLVILIVYLHKYVTYIFNLIKKILMRDKIMLQGKNLPVLKNHWNKEITYKSIDTTSVTCYLYKLSLDEIFTRRSLTSGSKHFIFLQYINLEYF